MRYVALLRGINLGGKTMIKMEELRNIFEALGFDNVETYINSGNVGFDARKTAETTLIKEIETAVERHMRRPVAVMIREQEEIRGILDNNPFDGDYDSHKEMHVLFLKESISEEDLAPVREAAPEEERFVAAGREIYLHLPMGVAGSLMGRGLIEKKLRIAVTARNWRTVEKIADL